MGLYQQLEKISDDNPLKLVFKMAKNLLETDTRDEDIYEAKIKLAEELLSYDKVKNNDQIKALVDFLEYLFLIQNPELEKRYEEYQVILRFRWSLLMRNTLLHLSLRRTYPGA